VIALLAPGQGSQTPGMLSPWLEMPGASDQLASWSDASGLDLIRLGTTASAEEITDTSVTQPLVVAATLLAQHGSLAGILAAARDPKSTMSKAHRTKLLAATDYIDAAGPVVRVATDADVDFSTPSDTLPLAAEHPRKVVELAEQYGVTSSIARLQKALDGLPG